ncbi:zinc metallopeptidase [Peptostreptococcus faecalis]|uniref:zinc metallopeptidase n=1 Tax=Peptostreptococcus faecalis TaxID=2045015 RepID=UPI000C7E767B|nr:zinc metallopeptidase [Peptostreptococcus faecalis]
MYYDSTLILLVPAILLSLYASFKVNSTTKKYFKVNASSGMTGEEVARRILNYNGLSNVPVLPVAGELTDHYNPRSKSVSLSEEVFYGRSITSISVAAHECGHAIQDKEAYPAMTFRSALVPTVNFASSASWLIIAAGLFMGSKLLWLGIILFSATVLFQVVTLPVELNASKRALVQLETLGIVGLDEKKQSYKVLSAAALTYIAAALASIATLIRYIAIANGRD